MRSNGYKTVENKGIFEIAKEMSHTQPESQTDWPILKGKDKEAFEEIVNEVTYEDVGQEIGALVDKKNAAYGSAFDRAGKVLEQLYPNGVPVEKYTDMLTTVRILDKLFRIANNKNSFDEDPWQDIAGYGILETHKHKKK